MNNLKEDVKKAYAKTINTFNEKELSLRDHCCSQSDNNELSNEINCCFDKKSTIPSLGCVTSLSARAEIQKGEIVVDLGSGAGHDAFQAAELVGSEGRVIGIDFTPEMIVKSLKKVKEMNIKNIDFRLSDIEDVKVLPDNFADLIISNCVINLTLDKKAVFKEALRILKPGGRLVDADVIAANPLPDEFIKNKNLWCNCLGGALTKEDYVEKMEIAGFENIEVLIFDEYEYYGIKFYNGILKGNKPKK